MHEPKKPKKPPFPLWLHTGTGQWAKKILGQMYYYGTDKDKALARYVWDKPYREAGREPPPFQSEETRLTIKKLGDTFLTHKKHQIQLGELTQRSYEDYRATCQRMEDKLGKSTAVETLRPEALVNYRHVLARTWGPYTLGNEISRCRSMLRFAFENGLIDRPIRFGEFKKPKKVAFRRRRSEVGPRVFEPAELRAIIDAADVHIRRPGLSFYTLRHCFQTIGDQHGDYIVTRRVMGHADHSIADQYREQFQDDRLRAVTDTQVAVRKPQRRIR